MTSSQAEEMRAIRLLREAINAGYVVSLYPEDDMSDPIHKDSVDLAALSADVHACDMMTVRIEKDRQGASFLLVFGNDEDGPISDHTDNEIGGHFFKLIMPSLD